MLWQLLANHPELEEDASELALSMLQGASFEAVADDVDDAVRSLGIEERWRRLKHTRSLTWTLACFLAHLGRMKSVDHCNCGAAQQ